MSSTVAELDFVFERVFADEEARLLLQTFLKSIQNERGILFVKNVEDFLVLTQHEDQVTCAKYIIDHFISASASFEVKISLQIRQNILDEFMATRNSQLSRKLFDAAVYEVLRELKEFFFPLFVRSEDLAKFVQSKPASYLKKISIQRNKLNDEALVYDGGDVGCMQPCILDKDVSFVLTMAKDSLSSWKRVANIKDHASYMSINKYNLGFQGHKVEDRGVNIYKFTGVLPFPIDKVLKCIVDTKTMQKYDPIISGVRPVEFIAAGDHHPYPIAVRYISLQFAWPIQARDYVAASTILHDSTDQKYVIVQKSCAHKKCPDDPSKIRIITVGGWVLQRVDDNTTRYCNAYYLDMKGWSVDFVWQMICSKRGVELHKGLLQTLAKETCEITPPNILYDTLQANTLIKSYERFKSSENFKNSHGKVLSLSLITPEQQRLSMLAAKRRTIDERKLAEIQQSATTATTEKVNPAKLSQEGNPLLILASKEELENKRHTLKKLE